mgnify:CR=1 FL=1
MSDTTPTFSVTQNKATESGVLQIGLGNLTLSLTTVDGQNELLVFATDEPKVHILHRQHIVDFNDVVHVMWNLEKLTK